MATAESWEAKSRWFFDVNRDQFMVTAAIQEKVDHIRSKGRGLAGFICESIVSCGGQIELPENYLEL